MSAQGRREFGAFWVWHTTLARSIPAVVSGLGAEYSDRIKNWRLADYKREWGNNQVTVAVVESLGDISPPLHRQIKFQARRAGKKNA